MQLKAICHLEAWIDDNAVRTGETIEFDIADQVRAMSPAEREELCVDTEATGADLDYLAEHAQVTEQFQGPFTVKVDLAELKDFLARNNLDAKARYVLTEGNQRWGHIFDNNGKEEDTRFVYDRQEERLVAALLKGGYSEKGVWWTEAGPDAMENLEDSLKDANPDALDNPYEWGLATADVLPDWAPAPAPSLAR